MKISIRLRALALLLVFALVFSLFGCSNEKTDGGGTADTLESASIIGEYALGDENPVITIELNNTEAVKDINADMFTLTGLFSELEITEAVKDKNTVTLSTKGTIPFSTPLTGGVDISSEALVSETALHDDCDILYRGFYIKQESFALSDKKLSFSILSLNDSFAFTVGDVIKSGELEFSVVSVSEDNTLITVSVPTDAADIDGAVAMMDGAELCIDADKTASGSSQSVTVSVNHASLSAAVDYIVAAEESNTYTASVLLFVKNGEWAEELSLEDITLGGDFEGAELSSLTLDQGTYSLEISFVKEDIDLNDISLEGFVSVAENKIKSLWNTLLPEYTTALNYSSQGARLDGYKEIVALIPAETGIFDKISTIGGYVSTGAGIASGVYTMLGMVGIVESTNAKINHVRELVKEVQQSIVVLDKKLDKLGSAVTAGNVETMNAVQYNTYIIASGNWDQFISSYVTPLQNELTQYKMAYNDYMLNYIMNAHTDSGAITVWIDENEEVTLPHPANGTNTTKYSIEGIPLAYTAVYHLSSELTGVQSKVMKNGGRLYDGYWEDVTLEVAKKPKPDLTTQEYLDTVQLNAALHALNTAGAVDILNAYTNFCNAITGGVSAGGLKPLDNYLTMLSMYYNFYIESANDIETTLSWLYGILAESSFVATLAYNFTLSAEEGLINDCYDKTVKKLTEAAEERDPLYSYLGNKTMTATPIVHYPGNEADLLYTSYESALYFNKFIKNDRSNFVYPDSLKSGSYMDELLVNLMMKRYEHLYATNVTDAPTFRDYVISLGIIDRSVLYDENGNAKPAIIIASPITIEDIPADNSVKMKISRITTSTWYDKGDVISIGSQGNVDKKYYHLLTKRCANTIDFDGNAKTSHNLLAIAGYHEEHWYWITFENWDCIEIYTDPMFVFTLE